MARFPPLAGVNDCGTRRLITQSAVEGMIGAWDLAASVVMNTSVGGNPWSTKPVHRILTFPEHGLTEDVAAAFLRKAAASNCRTVYDPFVGSGTVMIEGEKKGLRCIGQDANPWSIVVTSAKTGRPHVSEDELLELTDEVNECSPLLPSTELQKYHSPGQIDMLGRLRRIVDNGLKEDLNTS